MFGEILALIELIHNVVYYIFYYSLKIGQYLVSILGILLQVLQNVLSFSITVANILSQSLTAFSNDVVEGLRNIWSLTEMFETQLYSICCTTQDHINFFFQSTVSAMTGVATTITRIVIMFKQLLLLIGSGMWFLVTLIPCLCLCFIKIIYGYGRNLLESLTDFYVFVTDVPLESMLGIAIALSLIYICTQFYMIIFLYLYQQVRRMLRIQRPRQHSTINRTRTIVYRSLQLRPSRPIKDALAEERYCVICQDRSKCVLILPCRHMCMCVECSERLELYDNLCPICRNNIESTMKVFV